MVAWHARFVGQVPPPHVPAPHCALEVQLICVQVAPPHEPPLQSELLVHSQTPPLQRRPVPHWAFDVHPVWLHVPVVAPPHV